MEDIGRIDSIKEAIGMSLQEPNRTGHYGQSSLWARSWSQINDMPHTQSELHIVLL